MLSLTVLGALLFAGISAHAEELPAGVRVDIESTIQRKVRFEGETYEELSAFLYAGDVGYAEKLKELNADAAKPDKSRPVRYPKPLYKVRKGDTYQMIGGLWAGGSAKSYRKLVKLNSHIQDPNRLEVGDLIVLPRIPTSEERAQFKETLFAKNPGLLVVVARTSVKHRKSATSAPAPTPNQSAGIVATDDSDRQAEADTKNVACDSSAIKAAVQCEASVYEPRTPQERLELVQWYLDRQDSEPNQERMDAMIKDLLKNDKEGWNAYYLAGQYYLRTDRAEKAEALFKKALEDDKAPIQVGLFYIKAGKKSGSAVPKPEQSKLFERFPPLQSIVESEQKN